MDAVLYPSNFCHSVNNCSILPHAARSFVGSNNWRSPFSKFSCLTSHHLCLWLTILPWDRASAPSTTRRDEEHLLPTPQSGSSCNNKEALVVRQDHPKSLHL